MRRPAIEDRRIQKTLSLLREALVSLIAEKPYDTIVVKEILDRANVGRSTFYTHFRDKDDLLVSGIHDMLGEVPSPTRTGGRSLDRILWFSLPIFEHHYSHAHEWGDRIGTKGRTILHEHLRRVLTEIIAEFMNTRSRSGKKSAGADSARYRRSVHSLHIRSGAELVARQENEIGTARGQ